MKKFILTSLLALYSIFTINAFADDAEVKHLVKSDWFDARGGDKEFFQNNVLPTLVNEDMKEVIGRFIEEGFYYNGKKYYLQATTSNNIPPIVQMYKIFWKDPEFADPIAISEYTENQEITPFVPAEKEGYTFIGWDPELPERMPANNLVETAQYLKQETSIRKLGFYFDSYPRFICRNDFGLIRRYYIDGIHEPIQLKSSIGIDGTFGRNIEIDDATIESDNIDISKSYAYTDGVNFRYIEFTLPSKSSRISNHNQVFIDIAVFCDRFAIENLTTNDVFRIEEVYNTKYQDQKLNYYYKISFNNEYIADIYCNNINLSEYKSYFTTININADNINNNNSFIDSFGINDYNDVNGYNFSNIKVKILDNNLYFDTSKLDSYYSKISTNTYYILEHSDSPDKIIDLSNIKRINQYNSKLYNGKMFLNAKTYPYLYNFDGINCTELGSDIFITEWNLLKLKLKNKYNFSFNAFSAKTFPPLEYFTYPINITYYTDSLVLITGDHYTNSQNKTEFDIHLDFSKSTINLAKPLSYIQFEDFDKKSPSENIYHPQKSQDIANFNFNNWITSEANNLTISQWNKFYLYPINIYQNVTNLVLQYDNQGSYNFVNRTMQQVKAMVNYPFGASKNAKFICIDGDITIQ